MKTARPMSKNEWSKGWKITVTDTEIISRPGFFPPVTVPSAGASRLAVRRRWLRWRLQRRTTGCCAPRSASEGADAATLTRALRRLALAPAVADAVAHGAPR